jgi:large subunit ribosomal protein L25
MLREYQVHPIKRTVLHVDMVAIDPDKALEVEVPVEFVGKAKGTVDGGQIHVVRRVIPVIARPADIPKRFTVDLTPLDIGDGIHISDVEMPEGVEPAVSIELSLVSCQAPRAEVEETPEEALLEGEAAEGEGAEGAAAEGDAKAEGDAGKSE